MIPHDPHADARAFAQTALAVAAIARMHRVIDEHYGTTRHPLGEREATVLGDVDDATRELYDEDPAVPVGGIDPMSLLIWAAVAVATVLMFGVVGCVTAWALGWWG